MLILVVLMIIISAIDLELELLYSKRSREIVAVSFITIEILLGGALALAPTKTAVEVMGAYVVGSKVVKSTSNTEVVKKATSIVTLQLDKAITDLKDNKDE